MKCQRLLIVCSVMLAGLMFLAGCAVNGGPGPYVGRSAIVVHEGPPPPREEVIVEPPSPRHVWMPGYWAWHNGWYWEPGHYVLRPHPGAEWVPGHWRPAHGDWVWVPGHWR